VISSATPWNAQATLSRRYGSRIAKNCFKLCPSPEDVCSPVLNLGEERFGWAKRVPLSARRMILARFAL